MGYPAAIVLGSCTLGLALWAWPVEAIGAPCGPAVLAVAQTGDDPASRACVRQSVGLLAAGLIVASGGSIAAGVLDPVRRPQR